MIDTSDIGANIRAVRRQKGLTQEELAQMTGLSTMSIRRYEKGDRIITDETIMKIARALDIEWPKLKGWVFYGHDVDGFEVWGPPEEITGLDQIFADNLYRHHVQRLQTNISPDDMETLKSLPSVISELDPLTDEETALKTLLNSIGYNLAKTRGEYYFTYDNGASVMTKDDLNELLACTQSGLKTAAKTLELKLLQRHLPPNIHIEQPPQAPSHQDRETTPEDSETPPEGHTEPDKHT